MSDKPFCECLAAWVERSLMDLEAAASAIEARRAETSGSVEDESAVAESETPSPDAHAAGGDGK